MNFKKAIPAIGYTAVFFLLILDARGVITAGAEGIRICLQTVIPSLFPFLVIGPLFTSRISVRHSLIGNAICRICGIPQGSENIFLVGLLGGYPIGAQVIEQAYRNNTLSLYDAKRMLGFCNNAGPAFILGMSTALFHNAYAPFILWGIQMLSSILVSVVLPRKMSGVCSCETNEPLSASQAMNTALRNMCGICGWVVAFRIMLSILARWALWLMPLPFQVAVAGILELSNGCIALYQIPNEPLRFVMCTGFLSFGGLCVWMQTISVSPSLRGGWFFRGRCLHLVYSLFFACIAQSILFPNSSLKLSLPVMVLWCVIICVSFFCKKGIAFPNKLLYNKKKSVIEVDYAISQKDTA